MPLLLIPPTVMAGLTAVAPVLHSSLRLRVMAEAVVCVSAFVVGLPFALSLFRQHATMAVAKLEPEFQNLTDSAGSTITHLQYNKGL